MNRLGDNEQKSRDFIRSIIDQDIKNNKNGGKVVTRFPPEPNGYLHIGHAKSILLNSGIAKEYDGNCHLRFDDTNPEKEEMEYIESIKTDAKWLGFNWGENLFYASDYYDSFCNYAMELVEKGKAYVCDLNPGEVREYRGTPTEAGKDSPYRNRSIEENVNLFIKMKKGDFEEGKCTLRAKIDMAHPNLNMRDPALYRIKKISHPKTGDKWCIYPMYDFAHPISDAIEGITHSICTLEFEDHRPLYDWVLDNITIKCHPQQIEFARLELSYTVLSKRKLLQLVNENVVSGWDDPRMPTISGIRRRGYTPVAIQRFCDRISVAKTNSTVDIKLLEYFVREDLNFTTNRVMGVLKPLKVIIENYPEDKIEEFEADNNPEDSNAGKRKIYFSREIYIEQEDFKEEPPKGYFRLFPGNEVRLKHTYYIRCGKAVKDEKTGKIIEVHCTYDPASRGGGTADRRKVKGTLHWVSAKHSIDAEIRLYDNLFTKENPNECEGDKDFTSNLNPKSLETITHCKLEKSLENAVPGERFQFLRHGYFSVDKDSNKDNLVFNRIITLKDSWVKIEKTQKKR